MRKLARSLLLATVALFSASLLHAQNADLLVTKSGPSQSAPDTDVSYSVGVTNLGPGVALTVQLTDPIPGGMTFVSATQDNGPAFSCAVPNAGDSSGNITCDVATLAAGSSANFTFVFHIPPATPAGTSFINTATVTSSADPNDENNSASAGTSTPLPPSADLAVEKTGPAGAGPDTDVVYTITLTNAGPDDATKVLLQDILPGTMTFVSLVQDSGPVLTCTPLPAAGSGGTVSCSTLSFPDGATATFTLTTHIPAGTPSGTTYANTATISSDNDPNEENDASSTLLVVSTANVGVVKSTQPPTVTAGDDITYTIDVTNGGPDPANDVVLDDPLPPNTTFVSLTQNSGPAAVCSTPAVGTNGPVSCSIAVLGNGVTAQFTLVVETGNTTSVSNTATVSTTSSDSDPSNDSSTSVTAVTASADVGVTKNGPTTVAAGSSITYTVTVTNAGASSADNVSLTDTLPANTTFVSATQTGGPTFACTKPAVGGTGTIACSIAALAPGATATFTFVLQVTPSAQTGNSIANTASISTTTSDPNSANDSAMTTANVTVSADVGGTKSGPAAVEAGSDITYTLTIANAGPSDAANATISDAVPANTTFVSETQTSGPTFACSAPSVGGTGTITCSIATLAPGQSAAFTFVMHVTAATADGTTIVNTANFTTTTTDPNAANDSATTTANVNAIAEVDVVKTGPASVTPGTDATYVVTVTNDGPAAATSVTLTDIVPANTTFVSETQTSGPTFACATPPAGGTGTITCTIATLPADTSASFTIVLHVAAQASGTISNTASVTTPNDPTPGNNNSTTAAAVAAPGIPTLSPWALALLALALAAIVLKK